MTLINLTLAYFAASLSGFLMVSDLQPAGTQYAEQPIQLAQYVPPKRGAPKSRVGGGTRGQQDEALKVTVLAPEHTGHTINTQPTLYWYLSKAVSNPRVELTLIDDKRIDPILELELKGELQAGVHSLSLSDHDVKLMDNVEYRWSVAVIADAKERSRDIISSGTMMKVTATAATSKYRTMTDNNQKVVALAKSGLWYDAIDVVSRLISTSPSRELRALRANLMDEVALPQVAAYDRR